MSSIDTNERKRKPTKIPDLVYSNDGGQNRKETKARRVSGDASVPKAVASPKTTGHVFIATAASTSDVEQEVSLERIGALIQDLFHSDNAKVNTALDALNLDLLTDKTKCETIVTLGGCHAVVQLVMNCLDKATNKKYVCDQVTELNELVELTTLRKSLRFITWLPYTHGESRAAITAIGGVEAVIKVMKTFPKCQALQSPASWALCNLTYICNTGKNKAIKSGGIKVLLAAVNNHLGSASVCGNACWALRKMVEGSKGNTGLLISLGGATAVAKVRTKWPDNDKVQTQVGKLANLISSEMKTWGGEE
jgi:hypothetical protein